MKKRPTNNLKFAVLTIVALFFVGGRVDANQPLCQSQRQNVLSPGGQYSAERLVDNCGALTSFSMEITLRETNAWFSTWRRKTVFQCEGTNVALLKWLASRQLVIATNCDPLEVGVQARTYENIKIDYVFFPNMFFSPEKKTVRDFAGPTIDAKLASLHITFKEAQELGLLPNDSQMKLLSKKEGRK